MCVNVDISFVAFYSVFSRVLNFANPSVICLHLWLRVSEFSCLIMVVIVGHGFLLLLLFYKCF